MKENIEENESKESSAFEVLSDFAKDAVGYDKGFLNTLIQLRKDPAYVTDSYLSKKSTFVSPFKILFGIATIWILVMNFVFDWEQIGQNVFEDMVRLVGFSKSEAQIAEELSSEKFIAFQQEYGILFGNLFSKYLIILAIIITPTAAWVATGLCKKYNISFQRHLAVSAYQNAIRLIPGFLMALGMAFNFVATMIIMILLIILGAIGWKPINFVMSPIPVSKFFHNHGEAIEKKYNQAGLIILLASALIGFIIGVIIN